jgi:hypothetical protein
MMDAVPDNEQQPGPPALRPPSEPAPIDPEQVRQFQQFQQFQELMRQQGGGNPLLPPAKKDPLWLRILKGKLIRKLALLAAILLGLYFAYDYYFGNDNDQLPASMTGGGTNKTNVLHETTPKRTVRQVYSHVAQNDPPYVCGQFEGGAEARFAANVGAATCEEAVGKLHAQIDKAQPGWRNAYAEPFLVSELGEVPAGDTTVVSSCALTVRPRLGEFTLRKIENDQWVIVGHRPESC